jgi:hypothetical protein
MRLELDDLERALLFKHLELVGAPGVAYRLAEECMRLSLAITQYTNDRGEIGDITEAMAGVQVRIAELSNVVSDASFRHWIGIKLQELQEDIDASKVKNEHGDRK